MDTEKLDPNSYAQKYGEDALRDETNNLIDEALDDLPALEAEAAETQTKDKADKQEQAALQKVAFIKDKNTRADFVKLQNSPPSKERNLAMINIIRDNLDWATTKAGKRKYPLATAANFRRILTFDPLICGLFGYEEFKGEIVFIRQPYWSKSSCVNSQKVQLSERKAMRRAKKTTGAFQTLPISHVPFCRAGVRPVLTWWRICVQPPRHDARTHALPDP